MGIVRCSETAQAASGCGSNSLKWRQNLAPRAGFEPATIRLTVGCSTAELPRKGRTDVRARLRITKPLALAKDEFVIFRNASRKGLCAPSSRPSRTNYSATKDVVLVPES